MALGHRLDSRLKKDCLVHARIQLESTIPPIYTTGWDTLFDTRRIQLY